MRARIVFFLTVLSPVVLGGEPAYDVYESSKNEEHKVAARQAFAIFKKHCPSLFNEADNKLAAVDLYLTPDWSPAFCDKNYRCKHLGWESEVRVEMMLRPPKESGRTTPEWGKDDVSFWLGGGKHPGIFTVTKNAANLCGWSVKPPIPDQIELDHAFAAVPEMSFLRKF